MNDVISDNDIEFQRLVEGLDTTRGPNSYTKTIQIVEFLLKKNIWMDHLAN